MLRHGLLHYPFLGEIPLFFKTAAFKQIKLGLLVLCPSTTKILNLDWSTRR